MIAVIALVTSITGPSLQASALIGQTYNQQPQSQLLATAIHQSLRVALPSEGLDKVKAIKPDYTNPNWTHQYLAFKRLVRLAADQNQLQTFISAFSQGKSQAVDQIHEALSSAPDKSYTEGYVNNAIALVNSFGATPAQIEDVAGFFSDNYSQLRQTN